MRKKIFVSIVIFLKEINQKGFKLWTQVRDEEGPLYGKWEFPGGKIEMGETPLMACIREVHEEVGIDLRNRANLLDFKIQDYSFGEKDLVLYVFISNFDHLPVAKGQWLSIDFVEKSAYLKGKIPEINHVIIDELAVYLEKNFRADAMGYLWSKLKQ